MTQFKSFDLPEFLTSSLAKMSIHTPTPIQEKAIPAGLEGHDILGTAQTGTGKTIAYLLPILAKLDASENQKALILAPTRELAMQIQEAARDLAKNKMSVALIIGGASMFKQIASLKQNARIIVGTPGRINDHLRRKTLHLHNIQYLVLDETDRMLDMGFSEDINKIVEALPDGRQTFMFSATMSPSIKKLSLTYLKDPCHISIGSANKPVLKIQQDTLKTTREEKFPQLIRELNEREGSVIIFVKTKIGADRLADKLSKQQHEADAIHGDLKQRKRDTVIRNFRNLKKRIMVATDVAARGLDIPHIMHVINYDLPQCPEDYIHRIGRTGRAGMNGFALSLISPDENHMWKRIHNLISNGNSESGTEKSENPSRRKRKFPDRKTVKNKEFSPQSKRDGFKKSEGNKKHDGFKKPEGNKKQDGFKKLDGTKKQDGFKKPEGTKKHDGFKKHEGFKKRGPFKKSAGRSGERARARG